MTLALTRAALQRRAGAAAGLPGWSAALTMVRGECRKRRCRSRWGVVRVSLDFRDTRAIDRLAFTECANCGRTWRRCKVPAITNPDGTQAVRLTLILPATAHRWYSRGRWHREGDDAEVLREASIGDLDEAARDHRARATRADAANQRRKAAREAEDTAAHERTVALLAAIHERELAEREAEREAAAREA